MELLIFQEEESSLKTNKDHEASKAIVNDSNRSLRTKLRDFT